MVPSRSSSVSSTPTMAANERLVQLLTHKTDGLGELSEGVGARLKGSDAQWYRLGMQDYEPVWQAMAHFTDRRDENTPDHIWSLQHLPVFTLGQAGKREHILANTDIPIVQADRGGQVTYHGPGQLIVYPLINLRRRALGVRDMVSLLEDAVIELLAQWGCVAYAKADAPGVYVEAGKIASLGLRVRKGCCFHGVSVNIDMDLAPFKLINPCGYAGMTMVQLCDQATSAVDYEVVERCLVHIIARRLAPSG